MKKKILTLMLGVTLCPGAFAELHDRGNGLIYDDVLDITWLQDGNWAKTGGYSDTGRMTWLEARQWVEQLEYQGISGWRLPGLRVEDTNGTGAADCDRTVPSGTDCGYNVNIYRSELAYMYHVNLGNLAAFREDGTYRGPTPFNFTYEGENGPIVFEHVIPSYYWTGLEYFNPDNHQSWYFRMLTGQQSFLGQSHLSLVWPVHDGDVANSEPTWTLQARPVAETWGVALSWPQSEDENVQYYKLYRDEVFIGHTNATETAYTDNWLATHQEYQYRVEAVSCSGDVVEVSSTALSTAGDSTNPTTPAEVQVISENDWQVRISWLPSEDDQGIAHYKIYKNDQFIGHTEHAYFTDYATDELIHYIIVAVDLYNNESQPSAPAANQK